MKLILASKSPRRRMLLEKLGIDFEVIPSQYDENKVKLKDPAKLVVKLAQKKAEAVAEKNEDAIVIGSDVLVYINGKKLGQPRDKREAKEMLLMLSGNTHEVYGGISVLDTRSNNGWTELAVSRVRFRELSGKEIDDYIMTGSPLDKAGSYGISDEIGKSFIAQIDGSLTNVIGLSIEKLAPLLEEAGIFIDSERLNEVVSNGL